MNKTRTLLAVAAAVAGLVLLGGTLAYAAPRWPNARRGECHLPGELHRRICDPYAQP